MEGGVVEGGVVGGVGGDVVGGDVVLTVIVEPAGTVPLGETATTVARRSSEPLMLTDSPLARRAERTSDSGRPM